MAAFVKSVEHVTTSFNPSGSGTHTNTINLTKSQDETKCAVFYTLRHTDAAQVDNRASNAVGIEFFDNAGTPAIRVNWNVGSDTSPGDCTVEIYVVEFSSNVTVQQGSVSLTGTSATAAITAVTQTNAFILFTQVATGTDANDDWNDALIQAKFNSDTEIAFERRAGGGPDWTVYYYVIESDGTDFNTEYVEYSWGSTESGPTNRTLSNSVTLANAFVVSSFESLEGADDLDSMPNVALTGTTTLTWYRNHGGTNNNTGTLGAWVVRASSSEFSVQRFATDVDGQLTTNQSITAVDLTKAVIAVGQNVGVGAWPITSTSTGTNSHDYQSSVHLTSTTNVALQRQADTAIAGNNNNIRFEVIEFELASATPTVNLGIASEVSEALGVTPVGGAASVAVGLASEIDAALAVTPESIVTIAVGIATETDDALQITAVAGAVSIPVGLAESVEAALAITVSNVVSVAVGIAQETDAALSVTPSPGAVAVDIGIASEIDVSLPVVPSVPIPPVFVGIAEEVSFALSVTPVSVIPTGTWIQDEAAASAESKESSVANAWAAEASAASSHSKETEISDSWSEETSVGNVWSPQ